MKEVQFLILGAGVSGLTFAKNIGNEDYLIIEKENKAGGYCKTTRSGNFVWDYAGHFFHFSNPELKKTFEYVLKADDTVYREKKTSIYYDNYYVDYPFQKNIHQLSKEDFIDCLYGLFEKNEKEHYGSFLDMLYGKFGEGITEKFLRPYNEKLYACNLNTLDVDAMGRFFPYANIEEIIRNMRNSDNSSYNQTFLYPTKGAEVFVESLLREIINGRIHYNESVIKIDTNQKTVVTDKDTYKYGTLISTIPLNLFVSISDLGNRIDQDVFSYNQVLVFNLGFDQPALDKSVHWIYVPDAEINFYRAGFYNNIIGTDLLSMYIEIGYPKDIVINKEEIEKQLKLTINNLKKLGIIKNHKIVDYQSIIMNPAYVHITKKSIEQVKRIKNELYNRDVFLIGRYGEWKYCSIEDCMIDAMNVCNHIHKREN